MGLAQKESKGKRTVLLDRELQGTAGLGHCHPGSIESVVSGPTSKPISGPASGDLSLGTTGDRPRRNKKPW